MNFLKRRAGPWKKRFAFLPVEITHGPGRRKEVWLRIYYVRWRKSFGAHMIDTATSPIDD